MTLFMRLLHYPGRGALNIMEPKPLVSCYLWQLPRCRIMTNELWAARRLRTNNLLSCCPPVYFPWQTSNDPSVTFCCPKITANSLWCVSDYLSPRLMPSPSTRCICQLWCPRLSVASHGLCDLCHHRLFCVIFVSDPPPFQASWVAP